MFREGMCNITLDDLLGNAFIAIDLTKSRFVSYRDIDEYAKRIIQKMKDRNQDCWLDLGRNQTSWVLSDYKDYFEEISIYGYKGVLLKSGITKEDLREKFSGYLPIDLLLSMRDEWCVEVFEHRGHEENTNEQR